MSASHDETIINRERLKLQKVSKIISNNNTLQYKVMGLLLGYNVAQMLKVEGTELEIKNGLFSSYF